MEVVMFITPQDSSYEFLLYIPWIQSNCFRSAGRYPERGPHGPRQDFAVLAPLPQEYEGR